MTPGRTRTRFIAIALLSLCAVAGATLPPSLTAARAARSAASPIYLTSLVNFHTTMTRNFNPFASGTQLDFTLGAIYEPLYIITTAGGGHSYPWLATGYKWADGGKTLLITIRHGVKWSDGVPFTAQDVLFTFTYGKTHPAEDQVGYAAGGNVRAVNLAGSDVVAVHFKTIDTTVLPSILSGVKIIPQHIWSKIKNPDTYTNPDPVGTGPFTQIKEFSSQEFILGKNPYYWQPGKPAYDGIRVPAYTGNDPASLAMVKGELDWTGNFVPNVQSVYVRRDPAHFHYFYATDNPPNGLFFNNNVYPFSLVGFRKAISYAINRQQFYQVAEYGYQPPSDAIGIANEWPSWVDKSVEGQARELATYNPTKAKATLAALGFTLKSRQLYDPKGHKVTVQLTVPGGWTDFVQGMQIIQKNLQALGIDTSVKAMTESAWTDAADKGLVSAQLHWTNGGATPYYYFYGYMSKASYVPVGQDASISGQTNWQHTWNPAADKLLARFRVSTDAAAQHAIIDKLQQMQLAAFPYIPIVYTTWWYTYSTLHFTGWPTPSNYYAIGSTSQYPDDLKVMTSLTPVK